MKNIYFLLWYGILAAANNYLPVSARHAAMGSTGVSSAADGFAPEFNPALAACLSGMILAGSFYHPWQETGLDAGYLSVMAATRWSSLSFSCKSFTCGVYYEKIFSANHAFPLPFFKPVKLGYNIKHFSAGIPETDNLPYWKVRRWDFDAGAFINIRDLINFGLSGKNLNFPFLKDPEKSLSPVIKAGISTAAIPHFTVALDAVQEIENYICLQLGAEGRLFRDLLFLRAGLSTNPVTASAGAGIKIFFAYADYALTWHPVLGINHLVSVRMETAFSRKEFSESIPGRKKKSPTSKKYNLNGILPAELEQVLAAAGLADGKAAADAVIKYRNSKKFFRLPELKKIPEITDAVFFKIEPCLQVLKKDLPEIIYRINNPDYSELSAAGFLEPSMAELLLLLEKRGYLTGTGDLDNLDIPDEQKQILLGWINF